MPLRLLLGLPWLLVCGLFSALHGTRLLSRRNMPAKGPFIVLMPEIGTMVFPGHTWATVLLLGKEMFFRPQRVLSFAQEQIFATGYIGLMASLLSNSLPLEPVAAGRHSFSLLKGVQLLKQGGIVVINPEGEMSWDGRPHPLGTGAAWLGLHTAAPLVPWVWDASMYDTSPRWQIMPSWKGRLTMRVGQPFTLTKRPMAHVDDADLQAANERIRREMDLLCYGPEGIKGWQGGMALKGEPLEEPPLGLLAAHAQPLPLAPRTRGSLLKQGLTQLLWRCPVCQTNDALLHRRPLARPQRLDCLACGAGWELQRRPGHDFHLLLDTGPDDLVGLDLPLSVWYDALNALLTLRPLAVSCEHLQSGEEVYLVGEELSLEAHRPNGLLVDATLSEPPLETAGRQTRLGDWGSLGEGRVLFTDRRLLWIGAERTLSYEWARVNAVYHWGENMLGLRYGKATYRLVKKDEPGRKWLAYARPLARRANPDVEVAHL